MMIGDEQIDARGLYNTKSYAQFAEIYWLFFFFSGFDRWLELHRVNEGLSIINRMKQLNFMQIDSPEHLFD
ncbi:hypothetical protein [Bacillus cereus]|uniref:hypothetical protein n=2 Tax=Bacillaceae TaxID=186817 RepID=UPI001E299982|nr:hypothetical protein [Bacillus cereus]